MKHWIKIHIQRRALAWRAQNLAQNDAPPNKIGSSALWVIQNRRGKIMLTYVRQCVAPFLVLFS